MAPLAVGVQNVQRPAEEINYQVTLADNDQNETIASGLRCSALSVRRWSLGRNSELLGGY